MPDAFSDIVKVRVCGPGGTVKSFASASTPFTVKASLLEPAVLPVLATFIATVTVCPGSATIGVIAMEIYLISAGAVLIAGVGGGVLVGAGVRGCISVGGAEVVGARVGGASARAHELSTSTTLMMAIRADHNCFKIQALSSQAFQNLLLAYHDCLNTSTSNLNQLSNKPLKGATVPLYKARPKAPIPSCQSECYNCFQSVLVYP